MTEDIAKALFEKYNPAGDVRRCPHKRAMMKKPLDIYAMAAVNLYGIIRRDEFVALFNAHHEEQTTAEEVYVILLPNVLNQGWYGFYKDYIVHCAVLGDFGWVSYLEKEQAGKPRYIPSKEQFVKFEQGDYEDHDHWWNLHKFMGSAFGYGKGTTEGFTELKGYLLHSLGVKEVGAILQKHNLVFSDKSQPEEFFELITLAKNNSRLWENKGHTPKELASLRASGQPNEPVIHRPQKVGPNQPCPCGSGKKYKKCCGRIENDDAAQLAYSDRKLFYETWYKLMTFVNQKLKVVDYTIVPEYGKFHDETQILKIRDRLWENPALISEFLESGVQLSPEETGLLRAMEQHHVKGKFVLIRYETDYAVFMRIDKDADPQLYAVKGITDPIAKSLQRRLPVMLETVLLPFKDNIIYDSFMITPSVEFREEIRKILMEEYTGLQNDYGIITKLP